MRHDWDVIHGSEFGCVAAAAGGDTPWKRCRWSAQNTHPSPGLRARAARFRVRFAHRLVCRRERCAMPGADAAHPGRAKQCGARATQPVAGRDRPDP
eukprot:2872996-Rhodomonas_salina.1